MDVPPDVPRLGIDGAGTPVPPGWVKLCPPAPPAALVDLCDTVLACHRRLQHPALGARLPHTCGVGGLDAMWHELWTWAAVRLAWQAGRATVDIRLRRDTTTETLLAWAANWSLRVRGNLAAGLLPVHAGGPRARMLSALCDHLGALEPAA